MSTLSLVQRILAILIFSLTFIFLTDTAMASQNSIGRIPFVISDKDEAFVALQEASATPEQDSPNWGSVPDLRYVEREDTDPTGTSGSLAEVYLKQLAGERNEAWKKRGRSLLGLGALLTAAGVYMLASDEPPEYVRFAGSGLTVSGVVMGGVGVYYLNCPGRVEREIDRLLSITDPVQRQRVGHEALVSLAHSARGARIFTAISVAAFAASGYVVFSSESYGSLGQTVAMFSTVGFMVYLALRTLILESPEEMAFQKYLEEHRQGQAIGLHLGIDPSGRGQIALVLSF